MRSWYIKQAKQDCWRAEQLAWLAAGSANNSGHPTVGQKQQTAATRPLQLPDISSSHDSASEDTPATQSSAPHVAPQQGTTDGTESETKRTEVLDHQSGNEVLEEADTGKKCSPPALCRHL